MFLAGQFAFAPFGNIPKDEHHPDETAGFVTNRRAAVIDVVFGSIASNQDRVVGETGTRNSLPSTVNNRDGLKLHAAL